MAVRFMTQQQELVPTELEPNLKRFVQKSALSVAAGLSWRECRQENEDERLRRLALLGLLATAGEHTGLIAEAKQLAQAWLEDRKALGPDEAQLALQVALRYADASTFEKARTELKNSQDPSDRKLLIAALGLCRQEAWVERLLQGLAAGEFQPIDSLILMYVLSTDRYTRALLYDFLKEHYEAIVAVLPSDSLFFSLAQLGQQFDTLERAKDVEEFFAGKDPKITGGPRIIAQTVESIRLNYAYRQAQLPSLITFLKGQ